MWYDVLGPIAYVIVGVLTVWVTVRKWIKELGLPETGV